MGCNKYGYRNNFHRNGSRIIYCGCHPAMDVHHFHRQQPWSLLIQNRTPSLHLRERHRYCSGKSVVLNANIVAGYAYQWKKAGVSIAGAISSSYTATTTGVYSVLVTNNAGCSTTSAELNVTSGTPPPASMVAAGPATFCAGKNVLLKATAGSGYTYQWKKNGINIPEQTQSSYTAGVTGAYSVVVTNAAGCSTSSTGINVTVNPVPTATLRRRKLA